AISMFQVRKINFLVAFLFISIFLSIGIFGSYGSFIILKNFDYHPRAIAQIGAFFAIVTIRATLHRQKFLNFISKCLIFYISYSLITISSAYANALDAQEKFDQYRIELMISDLEHLLPPDKQEKYTTFIKSKRQRPYYNAVYSKVLPLISVLTSQIDAQSVYQLRQKDIIVTRAKTCKKENEKAKKVIETKFHKIEVYDNNCFEIEFR
ncbi:MAG: hypothetical protein IJ211_08425, partial [Campylobacter sp.]|nr:hypothetical protein [Campylobacter sp.]